MKNSAVLCLTVLLMFSYECFATTCPYKICSCNAQWLYCYFKHLTSIPILDTANTTQWGLTFEYNNITHIKAGDEFPSSITLLQLRNNPLKHIDATSFTSLSSLDELFISSDDLRSISHIVFPSSLERLTSSDNVITSVSALQFTNNDNSLKYIDLGVNPISNITRDAFSHLHHLETLHLHNTSLTSIDHLDIPASLKNLVLVGTPLRRLPMVLSSLTSLQSLDLRGIPSLECTCKEASLAAWYQARNHGSSADGAIDIKGDCVGGTSVVYFLTQLAPKCPRSA